MYRPSFRISPGLAVFLTALTAHASHAAWPTDTAVNLPICTVPYPPYLVRIVPGPGGQAIYSWVDNRNPNEEGFAQKTSADGTLQWTVNGTSEGLRRVEDLVPDGQGGAIVVSSEHRTGAENTDIYLQRIDAAGLPMWGAGGIPICTALHEQNIPHLVSDGAGGAIAAWHDSRNGFDLDLYAQRVNAAGVPQWTANGVAVSTGGGDQYDFQLVSDGAGGALFAWSDMSDVTTRPDVFAQHVNAAGTALWGFAGTQIVKRSGAQGIGVIANTPVCSDGSGGMIVVWVDRPGATADLWAQRIDAGGVVEWTTDGVRLTNDASTEDLGGVVSDNAGGAIVYWSDDGTTSRDVFAQRLDGSGSILWGAGVAVGAAPGGQQNSTAISNGIGGAIIAWSDFRSGTDFDLYAQRLDAMGFPRWRIDGALVSSAIDDQRFAQICTDGGGGAIATWIDSRPPTESDVYAQRIDSTGTVAPTLAVSPSPSRFEWVGLPSPNPDAGQAIRLRISLTRDETLEIRVLDALGREIRFLTNSRLESGVHEIVWDARDRQGRPASPGIYRIRVDGRTGSVTRKVAIVR